jgi:hypothetical protein
MLDAALACGLSYPRAFLSFVGVRIGTATGFKSSPPSEVIEAARAEVASITGTPIDKIDFDAEQSRFHISVARSVGY